MTTILEEPIVLVVEDAVLANEPGHIEAKKHNHNATLIVNREASVVDAESLAAFLDLLYAADEDYIDAGPPPASWSQPLLNWDEVGEALAESQQMLLNMQGLLSLTLAEMGVAEHNDIRVLEDTEGKLRLVVDHPRREEIEEELNSPKNRQLQELHRAAMNGMSLAGSLVGNGALPVEVLQAVMGKTGVA